MISKDILTYPILERCGLGNMLLLWARCYIYSKKNNIPMISPTWTKIRIGPYIRREKDKRNYQFLFSNKGYISGIKKLYYLLFYKKVYEYDKALEKNKYNLFKRKIVCFRGLGEGFKPIKGKNKEILKELKRITKNQYLPKKISKKFIGIHIRRGDFSIPVNDEVLYDGKHNFQIKIGWYINILNKIREKLGYNMKAIVFSDGKKKELVEICKLSNVGVSIKNSAITDLLMLSNASIMIASRSSFSMWASFLGQVPCIWFPGQRPEVLLNDNGEKYLEPEIGYKDYIPDNFIEYCEISGRV
jgi:hypothetical protein